MAGERAFDLDTEIAHAVTGGSLVDRLAIAYTVPMIRVVLRTP